MIKKYRSKTEGFEAVFWDGTNVEEVKEFLGSVFKKHKVERHPGGKTQIEYFHGIFSTIADNGSYFFYDENGFLTHLSSTEFNKNFVEVGED